jgi:hypothetical protein
MQNKQNEHLPPLASRADDELLLPAEVAAYLRISPHTLDAWRRENPPRGPAHQRIGNGRTSPVRYRADVLRAWIADPSATTGGGETPAHAA